jgi:hypothetical protein
VIPYPGAVQRCIACSHEFTWRVELRTGRIAAVDETPLPGGNAELIYDDSYERVEPHPAVERPALHGVRCGGYVDDRLAQREE